MRFEVLEREQAPVVNGRVHDLDLFLRTANQTQDTNEKLRSAREAETRAQGGASDTARSLTVLLVFMIMYCTSSGICSTALACATEDSRSVTNQCHRFSALPLEASMDGVNKEALTERRAEERSDPRSYAPEQRRRQTQDGHREQTVH